jgi:hypothetical protein
MDLATIRKVFAFGIYLFLLRNSLETEDQGTALANAPTRASEAVRQADLLLQALGEDRES